MSGSIRPLQAQVLFWLDIYNQLPIAGRGSVEPRISTKLAFWCKLLAESDMLITKMIAAQGLLHSISYLSFFGVDVDAIDSLKPAINQSERDMALVMLGELLFIRGYQESYTKSDVIAVELWGDDFDYYNEERKPIALLPNLLALLLKLQATENLQWNRLQRAVNLLSRSDYRDVMQGRLLDVLLAVEERVAFYNPIGNHLMKKHLGIF